MIEFPIFEICSLVGRYFFNMYIVKQFEIIYFHVYIILDFPITYRTASVLSESECTCLHQTVNMVFSLLKVMKIPTCTQKGECSCKCTELSP